MRANAGCASGDGQTLEQQFAQNLGRRLESLSQASRCGEDQLKPHRFGDIPKKKRRPLSRHPIGPRSRRSERHCIAWTTLVVSICCRASGFLNLLLELEEFGVDVSIRCRASRFLNPNTYPRSRPSLRFNSLSCEQVPEPSKLKKIKYLYNIRFNSLSCEQVPEPRNTLCVHAC